MASLTPATRFMVFRQNETHTAETSVKDFIDGPQCGKLAGRMSERLHLTACEYQEEAIRTHAATARMLNVADLRREGAVKTIFRPIEKTDIDVRFLQVARSQFLKYLPGVNTRAEFHLYDYDPTSFFEPIAQELNISLRDIKLPIKYALTLEIDPKSEDETNPLFALSENYEYTKLRTESFRLSDLKDPEA